MRLALLVALALLAGCVQEPNDEAPRDTPLLADLPMLVVGSPAFEDGQPIPKKHGCDGDGVSPPLAVADAPPDAASVALIVGDPDAPLPQLARQNFTHWLAWNVPVAGGNASFPEGKAPDGAVEGKNGGGGNGWTAPCPPIGSAPHRYVFTFYALNATLDLEGGATRDELERALEGHVLATGTLTGTYQRLAP